MEVINQFKKCIFQWFLLTFFHFKNFISTSTCYCLVICLCWMISAPFLETFNRIVYKNCFRLSTIFRSGQKIDIWKAIVLPLFGNFLDIHEWLMNIFTFLQILNFKFSVYLNVKQKLNIFNVALIFYIIQIKCVIILQMQMSILQII